MSKTLSFIMVLFVEMTAFGQSGKTFEFKNTLSDTSRVKIDYTLSGRNYFGDIIARKMYLLEKTYTYIEKGTPMSPSDKTIVQKPVIFYALKKLTGYYKKEVKKGHIEQADAIDKIYRDLNIGFAIFTQDTDKLEDYLRGIKKPEEIAETFDNIKLK